MSIVNIESLLVTDDGLKQIGHLMAMDGIHDEIMQHLNLLDVESSMLDRIEFYFSEKAKAMQSMDKDAINLVPELEADSYILQGHIKYNLSDDKEPIYHAPIDTRKLDYTPSSESLDFK